MTQEGRLIADARESRRVLARSFDLLRDPFPAKELEGLPGPALDEMVEAFADALAVIQERSNQLVAERIRRHWTVLSKPPEVEIPEAEDAAA